MKNSKYLFSWHGRFQISTINLRMSLFQVEGSDVGQNLQINLCNLLFLVFLCNFRYFRFRAIISLFLGAFDDFQVKFGFCYGQVSIMSYFRIFFFFCLSSFTQPLNRPLSLYTFFNNYSINKNQTFVFLFSSRFQTLFPCEFKKLSWIQGYFQKQTYFVSSFLKVNAFCFLTLPYPASLKSRTLSLQLKQNSMNKIRQVPQGPQQLY